VKRRSVLQGLAATGIAGLAGCTTSLSASGGTTESGRQVLDGAGRSVTVPESAQRIVAIGPGALRQVAYFEATDRVAGVERGEHTTFRHLPYNLANPGLQELPVVGNSGPDAAGDAESILAVDPDLVVLSAIGGHDAADRIASQVGVPVVVLSMPFPTDQPGREAYYEMWRLLGRVLGRESRAERLVEIVETEIAAIRDRAPAEPTASAYVGGTSYKGAQGLTTTRVPYPPFELAAVRNVAASAATGGVSVDVSPERLLGWDPEMLFVGAQNLGLVRESLARRPELRSLAAVEANRTVALLPVSHYHENVGSMLVNAHLVGRTAYPEAFADVSLDRVADRIYESLLGTSPYETIRAHYGAGEPVDLGAGGG
jgi:iron complex transport system substrate-binding protein